MPFSGPIGTTITTVAPVLGSAAAAATNAAQIQGALNAGGTVQLLGNGVAYINATLVIGSNAQLTMPPGLTLRMASGVNSNVLVNSAYLASFTSVTVTWTSGLTASVAWAAHGQAAGNYVTLKGTAGTTDSSFSGTFLVQSVTDANDIVVVLQRAPSAAPSGTIVAKQANTNISLVSLTLDYNYPANSPGSNGPAQFACIMSGVANLRVTDYTGFAAPKYLICVSAVNDFRITNTTGISHGSDIFKGYGPAFNGTVDGVHGQAGDDMVSLQTQEYSPFDVYDISGWGDVLNVYVDGVDASTLSTGSGVAIYPGPNQIMDQIDLRRITPKCVSAAPISISGQGGSAGVIGSIRIRDASLRPDQTVNYLGTGNAFTCDLLDFVGGGGPLDLTSNGATLLSLTSGTFKEVSVSGVRFKRNSNGVPLYVAGASILSLSLKNSYVFGNGSGSALNLASGTVRKVVLSDNVFESCLSAAQIATATDVTFINNQLNFCTQGLNVTAAANVTVGGNTCTGGLSGGLVRVNGAITATIFSYGGNTGLSAGQWVVKVSGSETINIFAEDFQVDVTTMARVNGGKCLNTNTAAGTLASAGVVDCLGTASGSWHLRGTPTLVY